MAYDTEQYVVNYQINVNSEKALASIRKFQEATIKMEQLSNKFTSIAKKMGAFNKELGALSKGVSININANTTNAAEKLEAICAKIRYIKANKNLAVTTSVMGGTGKATGSSTKPIVTPTPPQPATPKPIPQTSQKAVPARGKNLSYKIFGPSMMDTGGIAAVDMAKGFGIAYGMSGMMSALNSIVRDATAYDNLTKTTQNILSTNDKNPGFISRFNAMNKVMRQVGVETKFTAPEVADAGKFLAMAGFNTGQITESIRPIANMALVGDTDLGQTADVVTNIMTGYGIEAKKIGRVADIMTMTSTNANTTIMEMAEAYKYSASLLKGSGVAFEDATAAMGILGDAGIKGSQAGTSLRTILVNLLKPTSKQSKVWDQLGVARLNKDGNVRSLPEIFGELKAKGATTTDLASMFHKTALQGAISLTENVAKWNDIILKNFLSKNLATKLAEEKKNTIQGLWAQLTSAFTDSGITVFNGMQDTIKGYLHGAIDWLKSPDAIKAIKDVAGMAKTMFQGLIATASAFQSLYHTFAPFIKMWIQFQAFSMPFLAIGRSVKAVYNLLSGLTKVLTTLRIIQAFNIIGAGGGTKISKILAGVGSAELGTEIAPKGLTAAGASALGIFGVAAGIGTAAYFYTKDILDTVNSIKAWRGEIEKINGVDISSHASNMVKYLTVTENKQKDVNKQLGSYIKLLREAAGLGGDFDKNKDNKVAYSSTLGEIYDNMNYSFARKGITPGVGAMAGAVVATENIPKNYQDLLNIQRNFQMPNAILAQERTDRAFLVNKAISLKEDSDRAIIGERNYRRYLRTGSTKDWQNAQNMKNEEVGGLHSLIHYKNWTHDWSSQATELALTHTDTYINALQRALGFDFEKGGIYNKSINNLKNYLSQIEGGVDITDKTKQILMSSLGVGGVDPRLGSIFSNQWLLKFGYNNDAPDGKQWEGGKVWDVDKKQMVSMTADEAMRNMMLLFKHIQESLAQLNPIVRETFNKWLENPIWGKAGQGASVSVDGSYTWKDGSVHSVPENNKDNPFVHIGGGTGGGTNNYKSHYDSLTSPKQVIVRINNLLNVEKVDMSNEKKAATVRNLKQDLAQALIDVVADFTDNTNLQA